MTKFTVSHDCCELCMSEYVSEQSEKRLKYMKNDEKKSAEAHKIIEESQKAAEKLCVKYSCREQMFDNFAYHNLCVEHLYKMIDAIIDYEENQDELSFM